MVSHLAALFSYGHGQPMVHYQDFDVLPKPIACANVSVKLRKGRRQVCVWGGQPGETLKKTSLLLLWSHCHLSRVLYAVLSKTHSSQVADMVQPWMFSGMRHQESCVLQCTVSVPLFAVRM